MLHGEADGVVPTEISQGFVDEIAKVAPSVPVAHKFYPAEGHHFHQAPNIKEALERESG